MTSGTGNPRGTDRISVDARGWGGETGDWLLNAYGVPGDEDILELGSSDGCCGSVL